ncbi:hypothetical protein [Candidatus Pantoea floridensis]|uniref:Uncharacterized protein n=1 Tax=Candidatus Pantoea floridensis TaxID=1938870 RepID=A0A286DS84_9GAMM|nr:hypothetical protein [Pantoea floridensis]PIF06847.1 hypothetical protein BX596_5145 [Enterobacteriaceae bacterium JKS000233]SOD61511.1 hypothetical protein SAMN06273570_5172 [Pantoea floridensis]
MTCFDRMTDAALDAEIERLAREIAVYEDSYDAEYQNKNDVEREFNQGMIKKPMEDTIASWTRAMDERRRRMGFWIAP